MGQDSLQDSSMDTTGDDKAAVERSVVVNLLSKDELYEAYMPFLHNGGLFLPTRGNFRLGQTLHLRLNLIDEPEKIPVTAHVVWVTPQDAHGRRVAGIGVQFTDKQGSLRDKIEASLADRLNSQSPTHTL